jgi:hypothetical protein
MVSVQKKQQKEQGENNQRVSSLECGCKRVEHVDIWLKSAFTA